MTQTTIRIQSLLLAATLAASVWAADAPNDPADGPKTAVPVAGAAPAAPPNLTDLKALLEQQKKQIEQLKTALDAQQKLIEQYAGVPAAAPATAPAPAATPAVAPAPAIPVVASTTPMLPPPANSGSQGLPIGAAPAG